MGRRDGLRAGKGAVPGRPLARSVVLADRQTLHISLVLPCRPLEMLSAVTAVPTAASLHLKGTQVPCHVRCRTFQFSFESSRKTDKNAVQGSHRACASQKYRTPRPDAARLPEPPGTLMHPARRPPVLSGASPRWWAEQNGRQAAPGS